MRCKKMELWDSKAPTWFKVACRHYWMDGGLWRSSWLTLLTKMQLSLLSNDWPAHSLKWYSIYVQILQLTSTPQSQLYRFKKAINAINHTIWLFSIEYRYHAGLTSKLTETHTDDNIWKTSACFRLNSPRKAGHATTIQLVYSLPINCYPPSSKLTVASVSPHLYKYDSVLCYCIQRLL